jgi:peptidoglycan/xylan/chitin deacetylase (PgdA/CDA1 family)
VRTKPLWKQNHPQRSDPNDIFAWKEQVEEHLYGPPEMQNALLKGKTDTELDGAIILMHVGERCTADALPAIISNLQARGFHLVTISTLLR